MANQNCPNGTAPQTGYYYPDPPGDGRHLTPYSAGQCFGGSPGTTWHFKHSILPPGPWDPDESAQPSERPSP
ncbi:MAG: hypothetical protein HOY78_14025 [Saccharothrix sp.]|nr:hypothetical protein [Saccharothrix sp.]